MLTLPSLLWCLQLYGLLLPNSGVSTPRPTDHPTDDPTTPFPTISPTPEPTERPTLFPPTSFPTRARNNVNIVNNVKSSSSTSQSSSDSDSESDDNDSDASRKYQPSSTNGKYDHETTANEINGNIQYVDENYGVIDNASDKIDDDNSSHMSREGLLILIIACLIILLLLIIGLWCFCRHTKNNIMTDDGHERVSTFEDAEGCDNDQKGNMFHSVK